MPPHQRPARARRARLARCGFAIAVVAGLLALGAVAAPRVARAQDEVENPFEGFGSATAVEGAAEAPAEGDGTLSGQVFDDRTGAPIAGATVILAPAGGGAGARQQVRTTSASGDFDFGAVAAGRYDVQFVKAGYRTSKVTGVEVVAGEDAVQNFPMPALAAASSEAVLQLDDFVVDAEVAGELMVALDIRLESDQLANVLGAEDLSKYAASDVADALKRVAGVNIVEGQFAIIRGLEDRYSSTLYNGAPVPSPDPDKQSVQLDLFPSDVVSNLVVEKTFGASSPSNSSGGSIDIVTHDYPEEFQLKVSLGSGFEDNALDRFLAWEPVSATGRDVGSGRDVVESDIGASIGGRRTFFRREFRAKAVVNWEIDYGTAFGFQESREPDRAWLPGQPRPSFIRSFQSGDLSLGRLGLSEGRYDLTTSDREEQLTAYLGFGFDLDEKGQHTIDSSVFWTRKRDETVQLRENGYLPGFDYAALAQQEIDNGLVTNAAFLGSSTLGAFVGRGGLGAREERTERPSRGALWFTNYSRSNSLERERDLLVYQTNGHHTIAALDDLEVDWVVNQASTTQRESSRGASIFFEPDDLLQPAPTSFPSRLAGLGPGIFATDKGDIRFSFTDIEENQDFARVDAHYDVEPIPHVVFEVGSGGWYERSRRSADSNFLQSPVPAGCGSTNPACDGTVSQFAFLGDTREQLGRNIFANLGRSPTTGAFTGTRIVANDAEREIWAWFVDGKWTFFEDFDLLAGLRLENIFIESLNDAFTGEFDPDGTPKIFPSAYLMFDRFDNPSRPFEAAPPPGTTFNDQILGIRVPIDPNTGLVDLRTREEILALVNGEIDERFYLPSAGFAYRPIEGLVLRGAYSQTVARPSLRELGYYVTVDAGTSDQVVGNPQLGLSEVESYDARVEYVWGPFGDLVAFSAFYKRIDDPIESIVLRDPTNAEFDSSALFRTFFNNQNQARLWGIEIEARKALDFLGVDFLEHFTVGGNFTYIDAEVARSQAEIQRSLPFFGVLAADREVFRGLERKRRLFGQPEWIANADVSFEHEEWGTRATLAVFAISDVLDAAGSATLLRGGPPIAATIDQYIDWFYQVDLVVSQDVPWVDGLSFKMSVKNLTDSRRAIVYDPNQTAGRIPERQFKVGRDFSFALKYEF